MPYKILIINTVKTQANGITNSIFNLLSECNHDFICDYIAINEIDRKDNKYNPISTVIVLPRSFRTVFNYFFNLIRIIRKNKYNLVHIHGNSHTTILELLAAYFGGCKNRIVHSHSTRCNHVLFHHLSTYAFNALCTHRFACGELAGHWMFGKSAFQIIRNGIDVKKYEFNQISRSNIRNFLKWNDKIILGHVGNFVPVKNHKFIIDIFSELIAYNDNYRLVLIGNKLETYNETVEYCKHKNLIEKVVFTGSIPNVNEYLCAVDIIIMPSLFEGVPLALMEAQASGLICLVSDRISSEVNKTGNVYYESLNSSARNWASIIVNYQISNERKESSNKAISDIISSGYSITSESSKLFSLYKSICDNN